jgi:hypothetical protein
MEIDAFRVDRQHRGFITAALNHNGIESGGVDRIRSSPAGIRFSKKTGQR